MVRIRIILLIVGYLLTIIGMSMNAPMLVDLFFENKDWEAFFIAEFFTLFVGISLTLTCQDVDFRDITIRETFVLTGITWLALVFFSSLPLYFSDLNLTYTDSFFESMSALTTTGATILTDLENVPQGILVWRAILQWLGGIGIIVMAIAILPFLKIGGMQLFRTESSDRSNKIMPRARQLASAIGALYIGLTILCAILLHHYGMGLFDAVMHALTTVSTGGLSTRNESIGYFDNYNIETVVLIFIILGSIPFPILIKSFQGNFKSMFRDEQVIFFFLILISLIAFTTLWLTVTETLHFKEAFRQASFNISAIITTAGFSSMDYSSWGQTFIIFLFLISVIGGCTGSTTGGIKIFRFQILYHTAKYQIFRLIQPHAIYKIQYNKNPINEATSSSVMSFFILFCFCFAIIAILLAISGLDYLTSMSAAASTMANLGPALGDIVGPAGNYAPLNDFAKWVLAIGMLVGRLEIFTIFVIFSKAFWRD